MVMLRIEDGDVLRRALYFEVEGQRMKGRLIVVAHGRSRLRKKV